MSVKTRCGRDAIVRPLKSPVNLFASNVARAKRPYKIYNGIEAC